MTGFLDTDIALAIKPTPQNKGQNIDTKYRLNGWDLLSRFNGSIARSSVSPLGEQVAAPL